MKGISLFISKQQEELSKQAIASIFSLTKASRDFEIQSFVALAARRWSADFSRNG
jgi:hypothetical protein